MRAVVWHGCRRFRRGSGSDAWAAKAKGLRSGGVAPTAQGSSSRPVIAQTPFSQRNTLPPLTTKLPWA